MCTTAVFLIGLTKWLIWVKQGFRKENAAVYYCRSPVWFTCWGYSVCSICVCLLARIAVKMKLRCVGILTIRSDLVFIGFVCTPCLLLLGKWTLRTSKTLNPVYQVHVNMAPFPSTVCARSFSTVTGKNRGLTAVHAHHRDFSPC